MAPLPSARYMYMYIYIARNRHMTIRSMSRCASALTSIVHPTLKLALTSHHAALTLYMPHRSYMSMSTEITTQQMCATTMKNGAVNGITTSSLYHHDSST